MNRRLLRLVLLAAALSAARAWAAPAPLTVVVSVDQMRADYLDRFAPEFQGGFARLRKEGAVFARARHAHAPTETSPGHAALLTGCFPRQHGIVANEWWDRAAGKPTYSVDDPDKGRSPRNLLCGTVGDALKAASPASRVVSVSGKDRSAILMGGRRADMALWYDKRAGRWVTSAYYGRLPDWVRDWDDALRLPEDERGEIPYTTRFDPLILALTEKTIKRYELGRRGVPDLLTVGLSATDYIGHKYGPDGPEMRAQLLALDRELGDFLAFLDERLGRDGYVLALSADHGLQSSPESAAGRRLGVARLMEPDLEGPLEAGLAAKFGAPGDGKRWLLDVALPHVYLNAALAQERRVAPAALRAEAARLLAARPDVVHVFTPEELNGGDADPAPLADVFRRSYFPERSGDLLLLLKEGVMLTAPDYPRENEHGTPYPADSDVPLVLKGPGIRPGRYVGEALATDLAPTLGRLLGVELPPRAPSRVLGEALAAGAPPSARAATR